jgi:hypothetical protein
MEICQASRDLSRVIDISKRLKKVSKELRAKR